FSDTTQDSEPDRRHKKIRKEEPIGPECLPIGLPCPLASGRCCIFAADPKRGYGRRWCKPPRANPLERFAGHGYARRSPSLPHPSISRERSERERRFSRALPFPKRRRIKSPTAAVPKAVEMSSFSGHVNRAQIFIAKGTFCWALGNGMALDHLA